MGLSARDKAECAAVSASNNTPRRKSEAAQEVIYSRRCRVSRMGRRKWQHCAEILAKGFHFHPIPPSALYVNGYIATAQDEIIAKAEVQSSSLSGY